MRGKQRGLELPRLQAEAQMIQQNSTGPCKVRVAQPSHLGSGHDASQGSHCRLEAENQGSGLSPVTSLHPRDEAI